MNKNSIIDCAVFCLVKAIGPLARSIPPEHCLFWGRVFGLLFYCLDFKRRQTVYRNIKTALGGDKSPAELARLNRKFYLSFGQNLFEILIIPRINRRYLDKYVRVEGERHIREAFAHGKGVIFVGVHEGSWELSNIITAGLGVPFQVFVRDQRYKLTGKLLDLFRRKGGLKVIERGQQRRRLIEALLDNQAVGMSIDQGGKDGLEIEFFRRRASMSAGAVRLALRFGSVLVPVFFLRINGPYIKVMIDKPFLPPAGADEADEVRRNLAKLIGLFEGYIRQYPWEYLWSYKVWKYSHQKQILILSDGKAGHLRQSERLAKLCADLLKSKGFTVSITEAVPIFRGRLGRFLSIASLYLPFKFGSEAGDWLINMALKRQGRGVLNPQSSSPDIVISCGSSLAGLNFLISRLYGAKNLLIMKPLPFCRSRFSLVVVPRHDDPRPAKNILIIDGALNLVNRQYLKECEKVLSARLKIENPAVAGLLMGGDSKGFYLREDLVTGLARQLRQALDKLGADLLVTASRRTPDNISAILKKEFQDYGGCKLLVLPKQQDIPCALGGILALSDILVVSPDSISMVSEAVDSNKPVLVFDCPGLSAKHRRFLEYYRAKGLIYLCGVSGIGAACERLFKLKPPARAADKSELVIRALEKVL